MVRKTVFACIALFVCVIVVSSASAIDINNGKWEITSQVEMPGMSMQMPATTTTQCLTKNKPAPTPPQMPDGCQMPDFTINGNTVTWTVDCSQQKPPMTSKGTITYHGDSFEGVVENEMTGKDGKMHVTIHMKGKRIGPCN